MNSKPRFRRSGVLSDELKSSSKIPTVLHVHFLFPAQADLASTAAALHEHEEG